MLDLRRHLFVALLRAGLDLADLQQHGAEASLDRLAHLARLEREGGIGNCRIDDVALDHHAEIGIARLQTALFGEIGKAHPFDQPLARGGGFLRLLEHDLVHVAFLRRAVVALVQLVIGFGVGIGDGDPARLFGRRQRHEGDLAIFRGAEQCLAVVEKFAQLLGRRIRDVAGLRLCQRQIIDAALLVAELVQRRQDCIGNLHVAGNALDDLPPQQVAALLGHEAGLGVAAIANEILEARAVEFPAGIAKSRIAGDPFGDLFVGESEPPVVHFLVKGGVRDQLGDDLPVKTERAGLVGRERAPKAAAELLQAVVVEAAELLDRNLGSANLGGGVLSEAAENVADAPDREADDQQAHDDGHHGLAEPIGSGFVNTAEHALSSLGLSFSAEG